MAEKKRGRHQSTDKTGRRTIARLRQIPGVRTVVIGRSYGGQSNGRDRGVGAFKLQGEVQGGYKGILQTSKGIQELYITISGDKEATARAIRELFPG
ncbi:MAG: hypothetical protein IT369_01145 [Candidatus Latescibacteria bacterium]|nr:hypothetical protein [Candidatus Latescibacterota bacterium]